MTQARENALAKRTASVGLGITRAPAGVETQEYYGRIRSSDKRLWQERRIYVQPGRGSIVEHVNETTVQWEHVRCTRRQVNPRILHHSRVSSLFTLRLADKLRAPKATVSLIGLLGCCAGAPGAQLARAESKHTGGSWNFGPMPGSALSHGSTFSHHRSRLESLTFCQHDMSCGGGRDMSRALIVQGSEIEAV